MKNVNTSQNLNNISSLHEFIRKSHKKLCFHFIYSILIDIFYHCGSEPILLHLGCCSGFVARSKTTWQSHVFAREQYEVTTLSAFVRDELHPLRLPSTANLTRELSRLIILYMKSVISDC